MPKPSRTIVVDANIARACGKGMLSSNSPAPECIRALNEIYTTAAHTAMCATLRDEWRKHAGQYANKWLASMIARKRFTFCSLAWSELPAFDDAASKLSLAAQRQVRKDAHLVALAMLQDRRILSLDDKQQQLLVQLSCHFRLVKNLHWANPRNPMTISWLKDNMPTDDSICISPQPKRVATKKHASKGRDTTRSRPR